MQHFSGQIKSKQLKTCAENFSETWKSCDWKTLIYWGFLSPLVFRVIKRWTLKDERWSMTTNIVKQAWRAKNLQMLFRGGGLGGTSKFHNWFRKLCFKTCVQQVKTENTSSTHWNHKFRHLNTWNQFLSNMYLQCQKNVAEQ